MQKLTQRIALLCGGLCLAVSLLLVLISHLSSRYILEQESDRHDQELAQRLAGTIAPVIAQGDLIRLEVLLKAMLEQHGLQLISVRDLEDRPLGHAGGELTAESRQYRAALTVDSDIAGEVIMARRGNPALSEQHRMAMGLLGLAILASIFAAALARHWSQRASQRLAALHGRLSQGPAGELDEISALEQAVDALPLDLIVPDVDPADRGEDFEEAGLLYIRLHSLTRYVETLDEQSLLNYTRRLQDMVEAAARLYDGKVSVCREFGLLVRFSGKHSADSPAFRCLSCAWLLTRLAEVGSQGQALAFRLGLGCALGEAARCERTGLIDTSIYPDLYNQHIINDLAAATGTAGPIRLLGDIAAEPQVQNRCRLVEKGPDQHQLESFEEPYADVLERQSHLLLRELAERSH